MEKELLNKIIEWDIENWSLALKYWENNLNLENKNSSLNRNMFISIIFSI